MDFGRQKTHKFTFRSPKLDDLKKLSKLVTNPESFRAKFGELLALLKLNMIEGVISTLVQFYDPVYHCFTFPDYQLLPTMEEYSQLIGIPINEKVPFSGMEGVPKDSTIARSFALEELEVKRYWTTKGGVEGLPSKFLIE